MIFTEQLIIDEIRRMASENGGTPPGKASFAKATGIRQTDWCGKFWARWSDAVRAAGLPPNQPPRKKTAREVVEALIVVARALGRFPTLAEMALRRRNDPTFPGRNAIYKAGCKADLIQLVLDYAEERPGYEDIVELCVPLLQKTAVAVTRGARNTVHEYVYLIRCERYYKIGRSKHPGLRKSKLESQWPHELTLVHSIRTDDPAGIEAYWHKRFSEKRVRGEWFRLTPADVRTFKRRKFM